MHRVATTIQFVPEHLRDDGQPVPLQAGDSFVVKPGARHLPHNAGDGELQFLAEMRPAGRFEEFVAEITSANNTKREGPAYRLTAARVINRFPDVEHPTFLPAPLDRALFATLAAAAKLLGLRIPPHSKSPTTTGNNSETD